MKKKKHAPAADTTDETTECRTDLPITEDKTAEPLPDEIVSESETGESQQLQTEEVKETKSDFKTAYNEEKEKELEKLTREIEDKNSIDTKKKRRNWWIKTALMLILIGVSVAMMFTITKYLAEAGSTSFSAMISGASWQWFLVFVGVVVLFMLNDSMKYAYMMKMSTGKFRFRTAMKTNFLGKYYDGITPLGTGGQPFQIYYLHKKDIPAGVATAIPLVRYIVTTIEFCLISTALIIVTGATGLLNGLESDWGAPVILAVASISMFVNLLIPIAILLISFFPRGGKKVVMKVIWLLNKMHIVKHRYPVMKKYIYEANEYKRSMKALFTNWWKLIPLVMLCVVNSLINIAIPFFAVMAIAGPTLGSVNHADLLFDIMCLATISYYAASLIPTPGNSGASEAMTTIVFFTLSSQIHGLLGWIVLIWRFATYYVYILTGIGLNTFEIIRSAVRQRRAKKKNE